MTKQELYQLLKDKPNGNVQEYNFKKKFPQFYDELNLINFPESFNFQQKLYHYLNNDYEFKLGICPVCGNRCKYRRINEGYNSHCSVTCSSNDIIVKNKLSQTSIKKYGCSYPSQNKDVIEKKNNTYLKIYDNLKKQDIFNYINSGIDKSGSLKKESGFRKHYSDLYNVYTNYIFPKEIKELPFKQKLWHFLNDIYEIPKCKICGKPVNFLTRSHQWGYTTYCSGSCAMKDEQVKNKLFETKLEKYGDGLYNNVDKQKQTLLSKDADFWNNRKEKSINTRNEKNNGKYFSDETINQIKQTTFNRYGVYSYTQTKEFTDIIKSKHDEIQHKQYITKSKNKSFNSSNIENMFYSYLNSISLDNIRQYKSEIYPYSCDFYISCLNLYIEIQGCWTHGGHPFDSNSLSDLNKIELWKNKNNKFYNNAIYTWTDLDVRKRNLSINNKLNYLEIFSDNINICIDIFEQYITKLLLDWCLSNELPGNSKWCSEHPIWDCNVYNRQSPRYAWYSEKYLRKAISNLLYIIKKDDKVKKSFIKELSYCKIENNKIISSSKRLLELILNRFTIAKIAPKVTAISKKTVYDMINQSGIDISCGVYVPMSGFGGIIEGVKMWGMNHTKDIEMECYDINEKFCNWYGWTQKDMLSEKVKTDKVVICCPPFGSKYEHWDGTPRDMSNKTFVEWYKLIKEYIDAPNYIIIGPEQDITGTGSNKGKKMSGLFTKTTGVMIWTDDMINCVKM